MEPLKLPCDKCSGEIKENFCPLCGQKKPMAPVSFRTVIDGFFDGLDLNKKLLYTFQVLLLKPEKLKEYLKGRSSEFYDPWKFYLIFTGILVAIVLDFYSGHHYYADLLRRLLPSFGQSAQLLENVLGNRIGLISALLVSGLTTAYFLKRFFRSDLSKSEIFHLLLFYFGLGNLITIIQYSMQIRLGEHMREQVYASVDIDFYLTYGFILIVLWIPGIYYFNRFIRLFDTISIKRPILKFYTALFLSALVVWVVNTAFFTVINFL